jgi:hypothetical protein
MKYVVILAVVVILVRIDVILKLFDKTAVKYQNTHEEIPAADVEASSDLVPLANDLSLKTSPYKTFLSMLNDFRSTADINVKNKAIEVLRANPTMFSEKLDVGFENAIFRMRDLLVQRDKVTHELLIEIMKSLKGENLEMVRRFFSFAIDIDLPEFLAVYSKSSDVNCLIMGYLGDTLSIDERYNELSERMTALEAFVLTEKALPFKAYCNRCLMVLKLNVDKLKVVVVPAENADAAPNAEDVVPSVVTSPEEATTVPVTGPIPVSNSVSTP